MTAKDMALIQTLLRLNKPFLSPADLEKVLGQRRPALYVTLNRLVRNGVLVRLRQGVYQLALQSADPARIANQLVYPSYLSFEAALSRYGILSQVPYVLTFATTHRTQRMTLGETTVEFHQLKPSLFFGYTLQGGLYVAEPEKAVLDQLYLVARGLSALDPADLDLSALDADRLRDYAARFPASVQALVEKHRHA
ncbi:MAG: type IV toxin-antitoxin system AbiEi family antitoxin domain-containing protein [Caldilineales bacterium]|nr:type IV toxin-antitoxin system AbiEi family antitoxin domain-containing protein [Caldilineales bacterium]